MTTMKRISIQMPFSSAATEFGCTASPPPTRAQTEKTFSFSPTISHTVSPSRIYLSTTPGSKSLRSGYATSTEINVPPVTPFSEMTTGKSTRLFYYKSGGAGSSTDTKFYLSTGSRVRPPTSGRAKRRIPSATETMPQTPKTKSMWPSGDTDHRLRTMEYHMAELSLHYRSGSNLNSSRSVHKEKEDEEEKKLQEEVANLVDRIDEEEERVSLPPPPSPSLPASRSGSPSISIGVSDVTRVPEPEELVHHSTSNNILNYVSIDECPIKHRKARRRVRSAKRRPPVATETSPNAEMDILEDSFEGPSLDGDSRSATRFLGEPRNSILDRIDRLQGFGASQSAGGGTSKVRRQFQKRNQLLRDQMNVYVAWRTSERLKERFDMMRGIHSAHSLLKASKEERLKAFSAVLRQKEVEYSTAVASTSDMCSGSGESDDFEAKRERSEMEDLGETPRGQENKLNQFWEILQ